MCKKFWVGLRKIYLCGKFFVWEIFFVRLGIFFLSGKFFVWLGFFLWVGNFFRFRKLCVVYFFFGMVGNFQFRGSEKLTFWGVSKTRVFGLPKKSRFWGSFPENTKVRELVRFRTQPTRPSLRGKFLSANPAEMGIT